MNHDYYIYPVLFLIPLVTMVFLNRLSKIKLSVTLKYGVGVLLLGFVFMGSNYSWQVKKARLESKSIASYYKYRNYIGLESFLLSNDVRKDDLVVAYSDRSPNHALILMDRKGWSGFQLFHNKQSTVELIDLGAQFLIRNERIPIRKDSLGLKNVTLTYLGDTNQIFLYKLQK